MTCKEDLRGAYELPRVLGVLVGRELSIPGGGSSIPKGPETLRQEETF